MKFDKRGRSVAYTGAQFREVRVPSGSTSGRPIPVVQTVSPGTLIHTAHATDADELELYACNIDAVERTLTIEFGGTAVGDRMTYALPAGAGLYLVIPGLLLSGGVVVRAYASATNVINMVGRITRHEAL